MAKGSRHGFTVLPEGCLYAQVLYVGIEIDGIKISLKR
jgi:hypothetical protein